MTSADVVYDKIHFRHDPKWSGRLGAVEGGRGLLCVACVIEMIESEDVASARKSHALSGVSGMLKSSPGALRELLQQDHRVSLHFTVSLLVLVQLLLELQSELSFHFVFDEVNKQLRDQLSLKRFLATFRFLGSLLNAAPHVANRLVTEHVPLLNNLCSALLCADETLKTSVVNVWLQMLGAPGASAAQSLPSAVRDRLCVLLLQTLASADSLQLIRICVGLLLQLVQLGEAVSVLMNCPGSQIVCDENQDVLANNSQILSQNQEQQPPDNCPLPLVLKKLLLSGDETLQVTSSKCIASVLVHSPAQYSGPFIKANVPGFLFDCLACTSNEMLLWSVYSCLVLLTEDPLFFSQCHSVYGIDSLVRSLKEALTLTRLEVPKQGLLLLTEILERQPPSVHLFPSGPGFVAVSEALVAGVSSSCLLVATQAASAASAFFRLNHQSRPVQYRELEGLIEAITNRFSELTLASSSSHRRSSRRSNPCSPSSRSEAFLLRALVSIQAACRLAEECASDPVLKENTFTAPHKQSDTQDSLDALCRCLLRCCDSVWIPTVIRTCECSPNAQMLQPFYSILSSQFSLLPSLMPVFADKLASSGFYGLAVEHKGLLCADNRNPGLNACCCGFLQKLSVCLLSQSEPPPAPHQRDVAEVETLLLHNLPSLCCRLSDWPSLLCDHQGPRATQCCVLIILHLALQRGDRLLPDQAVFSSVMWLLQSVQEEQGGCGLPRSVLRSALYLLAVTQENSPGLDGARLNCIIKSLSSCQSFPSLYFHHPALLHFICRYPELAERFGPLVLELWLSNKDATKPSVVADIQEKGEIKGTHADESQDQEPDSETTALLTLMEKYPAVTLTLLDMMHTGDSPLAERALGVLEVFLRGRRDCKKDLCAGLRPALLQALQRLNVDDTGHGAHVNSLPLLLKLLGVMQASEPPPPTLHSNMEGVHFKLLYHVSNVAGRLQSTNTETLLPALNYLYCCLTVSPPHCTDRAVSMLLSNSGLMDQLQTILSSSSSSAPSLSPPASPPSALLCCCHLLLSSLVTLQRVHSAQVHKSIGWSLDTAVQRLLLQKRNTDKLLLVSYLRFLQVLLDADLVSAVVRLSTGPGLVGSRPLEVEDGALFPLGSRGARCLSAALSGLLLQKHEFLLRASVNCLGALLGFLQRRSPTAARLVSSQPWSRFLLVCLLGSAESCLLHPAILRLIAHLVQDSGVAALQESDLLRVMEAVERRGLKELSQEAAQALRLLLTQIQTSVLLPTEEHRHRARTLVEALGPQTSDQSCSPDLSNHILRAGDVSVCLSDFSLLQD
ncbi:meiosis inhibitor protein 1 isoform X2 [Mugil cephalus]|uniref:meiosis inhibitor protein 1 isoform X2 n=1 Tax=Mugil cephalus TaxID=48193 RepID=UPI001FB733F9|nr:meiosis inhibitor protein 1 isoform X2 [Mugil cephalus]